MQSSHQRQDTMLLLGLDTLIQYSKVNFFVFFYNNTIQSPNFWTFKEPKNQFQGINTARWCSLAGRYDNPIPTRFLAPLDCVKIPTQLTIGQFSLSYCL